jgi:hypothetical protein
MNYAVAIASLALLVALIAMGFAAFSVLRAETKRLLTLEQRCYELNTEVLHVADEYQKVFRLVKKINLREANAQRRAGHQQRNLAAETPQDWKRQMMLKYPQGALSTLRPIAEDDDDG